MNIKLIRKNLSAKVGYNVIIIYNGSRNRKEKYEGVLSKTYRNIFTIRTLLGELKSFSYIDIITNTIRIYIKNC